VGQYSPDKAAIMTPEQWIGLDAVTLVRNGRSILDGITWRITPGEHWAVLGPNGSGKTTLLQVLAGYLWPSSGTVTVLGERFGHVDLRELRRRIGWVGSFLQMQVPARQKPLDFIVSGKFATIGVFQTPQPDDYRHAELLAEQLGCATIIESPYGVLSQGEKQRLLIARALIHRPQLLILDEPCAGLDLVAREQLLETLEQLGRAADAPTMVLVTHHLEEITSVFSRVLLLREGKCLASGPKQETLHSRLLGKAFGLGIRVVRNGGRYWAYVDHQGDDRR
jgi:iron complex transport system ATP-binding protein